MNARRGRFVTLEGGEGAGKSSLARALVEALGARGVDALVTREPGGSPGADAIRALLVAGAIDRWSATTEALLVFAARNDHLERVIRPALDAGRWVICDRYVDSTRAYQGAAVADALAGVIAADRPDLTLVLDIDPALGLARSRGETLGEDRFERMGLALHQRVRAAFLEIAAAEPGRCAVIDATLPADAVLAQALELIAERLG